MVWNNSRKSLKVHMEHSKKTREKNVKKVIWESMAKGNLIEEEVTKYRCSRRLAGSSGASPKEKTLKVLPSSDSTKGKMPKEAKRKTIEIESEEEEEPEIYRIHI